MDTGLLWQAGWALLVLGGVFGVARNGESAVVVVLAALLAVAHAAAPESAWAGRALLRGAAWGAMVLVGVASQEGNVLPWGIVALPVAAHGVGASLLGASRTPGLPPNVGFFALLHSGSSLVLFLSLGAWQARQGLPFYYITALPFLGLFFLQTLLPTIRAVAEPRRIYVRAAVLEAEVGVVLLAAALPAGLQGVVSALLVALFYFPVRSLLRSPAPPV